MTRTTAALMTIALWAGSICAQDVELKTRFRVKYVTPDAVYLEGGKNAGLSEGMTLVIRPGGASALMQKPQPDSESSSSTESADDSLNAPPVVAELKVVSVASTSAVCEITSSTRPIVTGDLAYLPQAEVEALVQKRTLSGKRAYPAVVSFTEGDPLDEEVRDYVPKPPLPEVNRASGRIGFDYSSLSSNGSTNFQTGVVVRADITRLWGSHWNLSGYWRGRLDHRSSPVQVETIQDLINRTYHLEMTYVNPNSRWVAGFGRLYLPWATSLDTLDGGYFGRRFGHHATIGIFAGSTPDPTSWSYDPNREIAGTFINFEGGSFENFHYTTTFGGGIQALKFQIDRPFGFNETGLFYKRFLSVYSVLMADSPRSPIPGTDMPAGISRSYLTVRIQPTSRVAFDFNHNYFRDMPTYDPNLIGTGLLDKILFQGYSGGVRVELPYRMTAYTNIGRSDKTGDATPSWNYLIGMTFGKIPYSGGFRADVRYSKFDSSFGSGSYRALNLSRNFGESFRWQVELGDQSYISSMTKDSGSRFINTTGDLNLGARYFMQFGYTAQRGAAANYNQWFSMFGYRFDNRGGTR